MSAFVSDGPRGLDLHRPHAGPFKPGRIREAAIDAACLVLSLAGAGALAMALLVAAELPSLGASPLRLDSPSPPASHG